MNELKKIDRKAIRGYFLVYHKIKADIDDYIEEIAECGITASTEPRYSTDCGDPTIQKAIRIDKLWELKKMKKVVRAIEEVKPRLNQEALIIYEDYLINATDYRKVCEKTNMTKSTLYRCADKIIDMVAEELD